MDQIQGLPLFVGIIISLWVLFWKGIALWRAAKSNQKHWFIVFLVLNELTLGILEIVYLFRFAKKRLTMEEFKGFFVRPK